ncbi:hypothetical protein [[Flexibacter] sp. ATCC 35208]|uniref:hypothetical protein n=1 Tax=[Flexibacter] sp. ATCC 35208 TaxID=1936242 RepID=UPI0009D5EE2C|nr:hypothetical protein [[Flexibacter] sp. ATCC 35208]OMP78072.1 hypothetical protein BW716_16720 [[Flexibacter] sp. ATCC 35208]
MKATLLLLALGILFLQHIVAQQYTFGVGASGANESEISIVPMGANRFNPGSYIGGAYSTENGYTGTFKNVTYQSTGAIVNEGAGFITWNSGYIMQKV